MNKKRPYVATVFNALISGLFTITPLLPKPPAEHAADFSFDTNANVQSGVGTIITAYTAIITIFAIIGLFKLGAAKFASGMAIPLYGFLVIALLYIGIFYSGAEMADLNQTMRGVFIILAILLSWLLYALVKTIKFAPEETEVNHFD